VSRSTAKRRKSIRVQPSENRLSHVEALAEKISESFGHVVDHSTPASNR